MTDKVTDLFSAFDDAVIRFGALNTSWKKFGKKIEGPMLLNIENILQTFEELKLVHKTIAGIFYTRFSITKSYLSETQVSSYKNLLSTFVNGNPTNKFVTVATEIIEHVKYLDPDNSLIGLTISPELVNKIKSNIYNVNELTNFNDKQFAKLIISWSEKEDKVIVNEVRKMASYLRTIENNNNSNNSNNKENKDNGFKVGEIVAVKTENMYKYGRIIEQIGLNVRITFVPTQSENKIIAAEFVNSLDNDTTQVIRDKDIKTLEKYIKDPVDLLYDNVMESIKLLVNNFLVNNNIITGVAIERWNDNVLVMSELPAVRKSLFNLSKIIQMPTIELYNKVNELCAKELSVMSLSMDNYLFYLPTKDKQINQLQVFAPTRVALAKQILQRFYAICESALSLLMIEKKEILNGVRKKELTEWWLGIIHDRVDYFLKSKNFDMEAIPVNYLEEPPQSMSIVNRNLQIIQLILQSYNNIKSNSNNSSNGIDNMGNEVVELIETMKKEIYNVIDDFVYNSRILLHDHFNLEDDVPLDTNGFPMIIQGLLKLTHDRIDKKTSESIQRLLKDIDYCESMKRLENYNPNNGKTEIHIVPVSGLILSRFTRIELELKTVKEVWSGKIN